MNPELFVVRQAGRVQIRKGCPHNFQLIPTKIKNAPDVGQSRGLFPDSVYEKSEGGECGKQRSLCRTGSRILVLLGKRVIESFIHVRTEKTAIAHSVSDPIPQTSQISGGSSRIAGNQGKQINQTFISPVKVVLNFSLGNII